MHDIIRLLPDSLANQIAAGEVVQRPASVVKELMENSIDAGASCIELIIGDYGKGLVQVVDNGSGMNETDARMALERHATSKISSSEDLFAINTMGFRGEAMASMAAVAQLEIKTRVIGSELGTRILSEASEVKLQEPCACEVGTSVSVRNLFYNVPARRNFLKSTGVEMKHIIDEFYRIALAYPEIKFNLYQDEEEIHHLLDGKLSQRIVSLMGKNYQDQLVACSTDTELLKVSGYVGKPEFSKKTRGEQFLYVNKRFIKSHYLNHAVKMAYEGLIPDQHFPFYVLFLELDPSHIDVNVHPTKTEIKFDDERSVYAIIRSAVKKALGTHNIYPTLDFKSDVNLMKTIDGSISRAEREFGQFRSEGSRQESSKNWEALFDENLERKGAELNRVIDREVSGENPVTFSSRINTSPDQPAIKSGSFIQLQQEYILSPLTSGIMIIDQKAAVERLNYERLTERIEANKTLSQTCLFPTTLDFNDADFNLVLDLQTELNVLGFDFEVIGKSSIVINGIPADIVSENVKSLFEDVIEQYKFSKNDIEVSKREQIVRALSKRAASNNLKRLTVIEMEELVNQLFGCSNPNYAPDGRPTFKIIEHNTIENFFR